MNTDKNSLLEEALAIAKAHATKPFKKQPHYVNITHFNDEQVKSLSEAGWTVSVLNQFMIAPYGWTPI